MLGIGMQEITLILLIAVILFGSQRLPEIGRSLGKGIKEFKEAGREIQSDIDEVIKDTDNSGG